MIGYGKYNFADTYLHYKKNDADAYLSHDIKPTGSRFYAKDYVDFRNATEEGRATLLHHDYLTIMTPAMLDFETDDLIVCTKDNKKWRINSVVVSDDGMQKRHMARPRKYTILELVG